MTPWNFHILIRTHLRPVSMLVGGKWWMFPFVSHCKCLTCGGEKRGGRSWGKGDRRQEREVLKCKEKETLFDVPFPTGSYDEKNAGSVGVPRRSQTALNTPRFLSGIQDGWNSLLLFPDDNCWGKIACPAAEITLFPWKLKFAETGWVGGFNVRRESDKVSTDCGSSWLHIPPL